MEMVNGYICHNCSDVALAKKGVDPAHPKDATSGAQPGADRDAPSAGVKPKAQIDGLGRLADVTA